MVKLIYGNIASLDGYIEDREGGFGWARPDEEVHGFVNDLERSVGTYLYGRRLYETMAVWETDPGLAETSDVTRDYAEIWQSADKIVYSRTLQEPTTRRTRIETEFDPEEIRRLKGAAEADSGIGGADLAATAFRAGLVDECWLLLAPVIVGGGKPALPDGIHLPLELLEERRFSSGFDYVRYAIER